MRILLAMVAAAAMVFAVACGDDDATCESGCEDTMAANCDNGPSTQAACEADCESQLNGGCGTEFQAYMDCANDKTVTCDASGYPEIAGCSSQMDTFTTCLSNL